MSERQQVLSKMTAAIISSAALVAALWLMLPASVIADDQATAAAQAKADVSVSTETDDVLKNTINTSNAPEAKSATLEKNGEIVLNPTDSPPPMPVSPHGESTPKKSFLARPHQQDKMLRGVIGWAA